MKLNLYNSAALVLVISGSLLMVAISVCSSSTVTSSAQVNDNKDLKAKATNQQPKMNNATKPNQENEQTKAATQNAQSFTEGSSESRQQQGRSMEVARQTQLGERQSARGGRMLDLDHLAGDIGKDDKVARERSLSGDRQSRILSEDMPFGATANKETEQKIDGRSKKLQGKKIAIKGFIPIMSVDGLINGANDNDDIEQEQASSMQETADKTTTMNNAQQLLSNYGGQTSIGHASFGYKVGTPVDLTQQQQSGQWRQVPATQQQQADLVESARANRRLLGSSNILSGLSGHKRFMSALTQQQPHLGYQSTMGSLIQSQLQTPMNLPPGVPNKLLAATSEAAECICVPFFQCKNGYLSESQLSKSQLQQIVSLGGQQAPLADVAVANPRQVPRFLNLNLNADQQSAASASELYQQKQQQASISSFSSQLELERQQLNKATNEQQVANDIYDQLRKNIESENLEQQLQLQLQQQQQQQQEQSGYLQLDERSKLGGRQQQATGDNMNVNATNANSEETQGRNLLNPLGRRSSGQPRCGIMRTCCRISLTLMQQQQQQAAIYPQPVRGQQHNARLSSTLVGPSATAMGGLLGLHSARPAQPQYQLLQPNVASQLANSQYNHHNHHQQQQLNQQLTDYQPTTSALVPSIHDQSNALLDVSQVQLQPPMAVPISHQEPQFQSLQQQRPAASFMAGRCGTRQTLGISGRVQNAQPAPEGETTAEFGEFPAHVAILKRISPGDSLFVCSAVLISSQWLATAAHCVRRHRPEELKVRLGEWDVSRDDEFYPFAEANIREIVMQPEFQSASLVNDLALLRMDTTIDQQQMPHISPACLATPGEQFAGQRCWLAGWGKDAFGQSGAFQSTLRKVDLPVVGRQECENSLRYQTQLGRYFRLHQSAICAGGERGKDACEGDGGAGLYCIEPESGLTKVVGLVSWGVGCGQHGVPGVYTNLAQFYPWIEAVVAGSGEENLHLDRNGLPEGVIKNLVSERSNNHRVLNGTQATTVAAADSTMDRSMAPTTLQTASYSTEPAPNSK